MTAVLASAITKLWHYLNNKTKDGCVLLNVTNREPSKSIVYAKFEKMLLKLADRFKQMNVPESTYSGHVICLTSNTSNELNVTLT